MDMHPSMRRLYEAAKERGDNAPAKVARRLNVSPQRLQNWESRGISREGALTAQQAYGVDANELREGHKASKANLASDDQEWESVKGYAQAVGLGDGAEASEYEETHSLKFKRSSLARKRLNPHRLAVIYGKGESMLPRIHDGDAILFDTQDTRPADGQLFVIATDGVAAPEYNVKRCKVVDDLVLFEADNPTGDHNWRQARRMDNKRAPIRIIGRVRWIGSWED
ncbi:LexA family transcriptional regulator [Dyella sp. KRB-257]|uniref:LexA family transcriptional regulator n=1 Tax=Dyella sp. KRB-257 TaxID=3400915 RepID=UPI003C0AE129